MADEVAARRYAQAAFLLASEQGNAHEWLPALARIAAFMNEGEAARVFENTRVPAEVKLQLVDAALNDLPPQPFNLAKLLVVKGRTSIATQLHSEFNRLLEQQEGIERAKATTAIPLSELEREGLIRRLTEATGKQIVLETAVEPEILGGVVVQVGDRLIDASTKARLEALRHSLMGAVS